MKTSEVTKPPTDVIELKGMFASRSLRLPKQLEQVARLALARPDVIAFGSARSIAAVCSVSPHLGHAPCYRPWLRQFPGFQVVLSTASKENCELLYQGVCLMGFGHPRPLWRPRCLVDASSGQRPLWGQHPKLRAL